MLEQSLHHVAREERLVLLDGAFHEMLELTDRHCVIGDFDYHPLLEGDFFAAAEAQTETKDDKKGGGSHWESSLHLRVSGEREQNRTRCTLRRRSSSRFDKRCE